MNKEITIYWAPFLTEDRVNKDLLYPKPNFLFNEYKDRKSEIAPIDHFLSCPAISSKFKNTIVFKSPSTFSYSFDFEESSSLILQSKAGLNFYKYREPNLKDGPMVCLELSYIFFAEESLPTSFTGPYFSKPGYTKEASLIPGEFDIGQWFRPYNMELQIWNKSGQIDFIEDEHLFYAEFKTDKKIKLKRFEMTDKLYDYVGSANSSMTTFGRGESLSKRYNRFNKTGFRSKVLTEIQKNLIND